MTLDTPRAVFETLAARPHYPSFVGLFGTWEFDLDEDGKWFLQVEDGHIRATQEGSAVEGPHARIIVGKDELMRLARGDNHENVVTALLRGLVRVEGDFRFAARVGNLLPITEDETEPNQPRQGAKS